MPEMKPKAPAKSAAKAKSQKPINDQREIVYPKLNSAIFVEGYPHGPLTVAIAKEKIGWMNEDDLAAKEGKAPGSVTFDDPMLCPSGKPFTDQDGKVVKCFLNAHNRPFDDKLAMAYAQDILNGDWETNCENIIFSKYGNVTSGQHRLIGLILAGQIWAKKRNVFGERWPTEPVMNTFIAVGGSEDMRVLATQDSGRSRTLADNYYSHDAFASYENAERKELGRMLGAAVEMLWKRTGSGGADSDTARYQTHATSNEFLGRHAKLINCVKHLFGENKGRSISTLHMSPGQCSASMYLMAASATEPTAYHGDRSEGSIEFERWDLAVEFWALLAGSKSQLMEVRNAMGKLVDEGSGGRPIEKQAVLAKAWSRFIAAPKQKIKFEDIFPKYVTISKDGQQETHLDEWPDFQGIDVGLKPEADEKPVSPAVAKAEQKRIQKENAEALNAKVRDKVPEKAVDPLARINELHLEHANTIIIVKKASGNLVAMNGDAEIASSMLSVKADKQEGISMLVVTAPQLEKLKAFCSAKGKGIALVEKVITKLGAGLRGKAEEKVTVLVKPAAKKPTAPAKPVARK